MLNGGEAMVVCRRSTASPSLFCPSHPLCSLSSSHTHTSSLCRESRSWRRRCRRHSLRPLPDTRTHAYTRRQRRRGRGKGMSVKRGRERDAADVEPEVSTLCTLMPLVRPAAAGQKQQTVSFPCLSHLLIYLLAPPADWAATSALEPGPGTLHRLMLTAVCISFLNSDKNNWPHLSPFCHACCSQWRACSYGGRGQASSEPVITVRLERVGRREGRQVRHAFGP